MQVTLDGKSELAAHGAEFREANVAELLGPSMALALRARLRRFKTAVPFSQDSRVRGRGDRGEIGAFVDFGEEPGALGVGGEKASRPA
jgi:hypothetical protein